MKVTFEFSSDSRNPEVTVESNGEVPSHEVNDVAGTIVLLAFMSQTENIAAVKTVGNIIMAWIERHEMEFQTGLVLGLDRDEYNRQRYDEMLALRQMTSHICDALGVDGSDMGTTYIVEQAIQQYNDFVAKDSEQDDEEVPEVFEDFINGMDDK